MNLQSGVHVQVLHNLLPGMRVQHSVHGDGVVVGVEPRDKRNRPYKVTFDNGEVHHYSIRSAAKLIGGQVAKQQIEGTTTEMGSRNAAPVPMLLSDAGP